MDKQENKGGRPRKEINLDVLAGACTVGCTAEECAGILGVSVKTIDRRLKEEGYAGFDDFFKQHFDKTKQALRHLQLQAAKGGNTGMLIWLGKQYLGQRDKHDLGLEGGLTIQWSKDCDGI